MRILTKLSTTLVSPFYWYVTEEMKGKLYSGSLYYRIEEDLIEKSLPVSRNKKFGYERQ